MARRTVKEIETIWSQVEGVKKMSDRVIGIGPFGLGLDALLTWVPVVGTAYSVGAGGWLLYQAVRAKAPGFVIGRMAGYLVTDAATGSVPIAGNLVDTFFPGHLMAARALQKHIESTHWVEAHEAEAKASGEHEAHLATVRDTPRLKRVVYLHD